MIQRKRSPCTCWYSFVGLYYIDAEGTGDLIFHNPINLVSDCNPKSPFVRTVSYPPKNGNLLLWPAWVPHEVEINNSDRYRINIYLRIDWEKWGEYILST